VGWNEWQITLKHEIRRAWLTAQTGNTWNSVLKLIEKLSLGPSCSWYRRLVQVARTWSWVRDNYSNYCFRHCISSIRSLFWFLLQISVWWPRPKHFGHISRISLNSVNFEVISQLPQLHFIPSFKFDCADCCGVCRRQIMTADIQPNNRPTQRLTASQNRGIF